MNALRWGLFLRLVIRDIQETDDMESIYYSLDYLSSVIEYELPEVIARASTPTCSGTLATRR